MTHSITNVKTKSSLDIFPYTSNVLYSLKILHINLTSSSRAKYGIKTNHSACLKIVERQRNLQHFAWQVKSGNWALAWHLWPLLCLTQSNYPRQDVFSFLFWGPVKFAKVKCNLQLPCGFYAAQTIVFNKLLRLQQCRQLYWSRVMCLSPSSDLRSIVNKLVLLPWKPMLFFSLLNWFID